MQSLCVYNTLHRPQPWLHSGLYMGMVDGPVRSPITKKASRLFQQPLVFPSRPGCLQESSPSTKDSEDGASLCEQEW